MKPKNCKQLEKICKLKIRSRSTRRPRPSPPQTPTLECTEHTQTRKGSWARSKQPFMHMKPGTQTNCAHNQRYTQGQTNIISLILYWFERDIRRLMHCKLLLVLLCYCYHDALNKEIVKDFKFLLFVRKNRSSAYERLAYNIQLRRYTSI